MASETDLLSTIAGAGEAAQQKGLGLIQLYMAGRMKKNAAKNFTPYKIPSSANIMLDKANALASQTEIPGADIYRSQARSNAAQTVENSQRTAGSTSDVLGTLQGSQQNLDNFYQNIAARGSEFYRQNQQQQQQALLTFANYETERWRQNEYMPYIQALQNANAMEQGANANISGAQKANYAVGTGLADTSRQDQQYQEWLKNRGYGGASGGNQFNESIFTD